MNEFYGGVLSHVASAPTGSFIVVRPPLLRLTEEWRAMRDRCELVAIVSVDLSEAFDVIQCPLLVSNLKAAYGMNDASCALLRNSLSGRSQRVKGGDICSSWTRRKASGVVSRS